MSRAEFDSEATGITHQMNKPQNIATYDAQAGHFAAKFNATGPRVEDIERLFSFMPVQENLFVIELGCGSGRDAAEMLKRTNRYLGIDLSKELLAIAKRENPAGKFIVADLETFDFPPNIDGIIAYHSLLHSDRGTVGSILARAASALVPGGVFQISLKKGSYGRYVQEDQFGTRVFFYYTLDLLAELARPFYEVVHHVDTDNPRGTDFFTAILKRT